MASNDIRGSVIWVFASGIAFFSACAFYSYLLIEGQPAQVLKWVSVVFGGLFLMTIWRWRGLSGGSGFAVGLFGSYFLVPILVGFISGFVSTHLEREVEAQTLLDFQGVQKELLKMGINIREQRLSPDNVYGKVEIESFSEIRGTGDAGVYGTYSYFNAISQATSLNEHIDDLIKVGWFEVLDPAYLSKKENLTGALLIVDRVLELTSAKKIESIERIRNQPGDLEKLDFTHEFKQALVQGIQDNLPASIKETGRHWDKEIELVGMHRPVIQMWSSGAVSWSMTESQMEFSDPEVKVRYEGLLESIQTLRNQQRAEKLSRLEQLKKSLAELSQLEGSN